jgi:hypothetical protein
MLAWLTLNGYTLSGIIRLGCGQEEKEHTPERAVMPTSISNSSSARVGHPERPTGTGRSDCRDQHRVAGNAKAELPDALHSSDSPSAAVTEFAASASPSGSSSSTVRQLRRVYERDVQGGGKKEKPLQAVESALQSTNPALDLPQAAILGIGDVDSDERVNQGARMATGSVKSLAAGRSRRPKPSSW